jgi:hypothetical protein
MSKYSYKLQAVKSFNAHENEQENYKEMDSLKSLIEYLNDSSDGNVLITSYPLAGDSQRFYRYDFPYRIIAGMSEEEIYNKFDQWVDVWISSWVDLRRELTSK